MFLAESIAVACFIYWLCAILAEALIASGSAKFLHAIVRLGFAYIILYSWFLGAWQFVQVQYAWLAGAILLLMYKSKDYIGWDGIQLFFKRVLKTYATLFIAFIGLVNIFFAPLFLSGVYGPFSEGGGDVSIYADTTKYMIDHNLPAYGATQTFSNIKTLLHDPLKSIPWSEENTVARLKKLDKTSYSPPSANYSAHNITVARQLQVFLYPSFIFGFFNGQTNYHVYYGIMAFYYAIIVLALWGLFRAYGAVPAAIAALISVSSHGLISVFYNNYQNQAFWVFILIMTINATRSVNILSLLGVILYGASLPFVVAYFPIFPLIVPLVALSIANRQQEKPANVDIQFHSPVNRMISYGAIAIFLLTILVVMPIQCIELLLTIKGTVANLMSSTAKTLVGYYGGDGYGTPIDGEINPFFGISIGVLSTKYFTFLFGILSQQHFPPLASIPRGIEFVNAFTVTAGISAVGIGLISMVFIFITRKRDSNAKILKYEFLLYALSVAMVLFYLFLTKESLYSQAKGILNIYIVVIVLLLLPYAILHSINRLRAIQRVLLPVLITFGILNIPPRIVFALKVAKMEDRSSIMEPSYFSEAQRIRNKDKYPFVLFEPKLNTDVYMCYQPFYGARMLPTKHLLSQTTIFTPDGGIRGEEHIASDFLSNDILPNLWTIEPKKTGTKKRIWGDMVEYEWKAEKLINRKLPKLIFTGSNYDAFFKEGEVSLNHNDIGVFSYVRNGATIFFTPANAMHSVDITLLPRVESEYNAFAIEVKKRFEAGEFGHDGRLEDDGKFLRIKYRIEPSDKPKMITMIRYSGECWVNVRMDGQDIKGNISL